MLFIHRRVFWIPLLASCFWLCISYILYHQASELALQHQQDLEHMHLSTIGQQLLRIRNWNADHGGIYVRESDIGRPNPWLPEDMRYVTTTDGKRLVLLNPAYMSRLLAERISSPGMSISIVGKEPMRPGNLADAWEGGALEQCTSGPTEIFTPPDTTSPQSDRHMRLLAVLKAEQSCLKCHTTRKVGDVLGGISISQDATSYLELTSNQRKSLRLTYAFMGLTGLLVIGGLTGLLALRRWQAEETGRMQRSLMARLSHDMRTPLTGILGMSELLSNAATRQPEREQALRYLTQASTALLEMVRDITDHAQLEQENISLYPEPFDLVHTCEQCVALYQPVAKSKNLRLELVVGKRVPPMLMGDSFRIRQVLGNLVSNAVKFTAEGYVRVIALARPLENGSFHLRLLVMDTGPGLPAGEEEAIFAMFQRGSHSRQLPGTGLGLGIARSIARKMGGDVNAHSRKGGGACFVMDMELAAAGRQTSNIRETGAPGMHASLQLPLEGLEILVAEDNAPSRYFLQVALQRVGAHPTLASDGTQALSAMSSPDKHYDLVILDARMPGLSGLDLLAHIRRGETALPKDQRAVIYAAALDAPARATCSCLGANAVLDKPLSFPALRAALASVMQGEHTNPKVAQQPDTAHAWNRARALEAMDSDAEVFARLCKLLLEDLRQKCAQLDTMLASDDREGYRRLAHACKNSAGTLCFARLQAVARNAEEGSTDMTQTAPALAEAMREAVALLEQETA